VNKIEYDLIFC